MDGRLYFRRDDTQGGAPRQLTRATGLALLTTLTLIASPPARGSADHVPAGAQLHLLSVERTSSSEITAVVAVPARFDDVELTSENVALSITSAEGQAVQLATAVEHLPATGLELLIVLDDSNTARPESLIAQQAAIVELVRQAEPGTSFLLASTVRGRLAPSTADATAALQVIAGLSATTDAMNLALVGASVPPVAPPMRRATMVLVQEGRADDVTAALKPQLDGSLPAFVVLLDGAASVETSYGATRVITTSLGGLVPVVDRMAAFVSRQYRVSFAVADPLPSAAEIVVTDGATTAQVPVPLGSVSAAVPAEAPVEVAVEPPVEPTQPGTMPVSAGSDAASAGPGDASAGPVAEAAGPVVEQAGDSGVAAAPPLPDSPAGPVDRATTPDIEEEQDSWSWWLLVVAVVLVALCIVPTYRSAEETPE